MVKSLESDIEDRVCVEADRRDWLHYKLNGVGKSHWPDRAFFLPGGKLLMIEFKRVGEEPRKAQMHVIKLLRGLGYDVRWTDSASTAIAWLESLVHGG